ncbi:MAG: FMN-binding protein, partial [Lactobacillus sp.]|nr:FMN-binding protein [Lactobacillus sp.]
KVNKVGPKEYIPKLQKEFLKAKGNTEKVQAVSGATESSHSFIAYADQLINAAQKGESGTIKVDNIVYQE